MRIATLGLCAVMGLGMFAMGCDESSSTTPKAADAAKTAADKSADAAKSAADAAKTASDKAAAAAADVKDKAADAAGDMMAQAQKLYDDAKAAIGKGDLETAQKYVDQLKGWQDKLPADWKAKVDEVVKMLGEAKDKLKNIPGVPK